LELLNLTKNIINEKYFPETLSLKEGEFIVKKLEDIVSFLKSLKIPEIDLGKLESLLQDIKNKDVNVDFNVEKIVDSIESLKKSFKEIKIAAQKVDLEKAEKSLETIIDLLKNLKITSIDNLTKELKKVREDLSKIEKAIKTTVGPNSMAIRNSHDIIIDPATESTARRRLGLSGIGTDTQFTITNANTAYAIPPTPPNDYYTLLLYNSSDSDVFVRFTSGTVNGIKITPGSVFSIDLGPNQQIYVYSTLANTTINLSYKII
jgi:hypothetical protein